MKIRDSGTNARTLARVLITALALSTATAMAACGGSPPA
jgi:hypothetical protein